MSKKANTIEAYGLKGLKRVTLTTKSGGKMTGTVRYEGYNAKWVRLDRTGTEIELRSKNGKDWYEVRSGKAFDIAEELVYLACKFTQHQI